MADSKTVRSQLFYYSIVTAAANVSLIKQNLIEEVMQRLEWPHLCISLEQLFQSDLNWRPYCAWLLFFDDLMEL